MKEFLQDPVKVEQTSKKFRNKVKEDLEKLGLNVSKLNKKEMYENSN